MADAVSPSPGTIDQSFQPRFFLKLSAILALLGALALLVDHFVSRPFATPPHEVWPIKGDIRKLVALSEVFGHGTGVLLIVLATFALDQVRRWKVGLLLGTALGAGLAADVVKVLGVARFRPHAFDFSHSIWDSFYQWLPLLSWSTQAELQQASLQSFPSAHAATAAGLCVGLCWFYPHGRWFFLLMTLLAGLQRIVFGVHFPSDVLLGAALGFAFSTFLLTWGHLPRTVNYLERKIRHLPAESL